MLKRYVLRNTETTISVIYITGIQYHDGIQDVPGDWQVGKKRQRGAVGRTRVYHLLSLEAHMVLHNALLNCHIALVYILLKINFIKSISEKLSDIIIYENFSGVF